MLYTCTVAAKTDDYIGYRESCHAFAMSHLQVSNSETVLCEILKLASCGKIKSHFAQNNCLDSCYYIDFSTAAT